MTAELLDLAERIKRDGASFALEVEIAKLVGAYATPPRAYTCNIDDALLLVPADPACPSKRMLWSVSYDEDGVGGERSYVAAIGKGYHDPKYIYGHSDVSGAAALCIAALKARAALSLR